MAAAEKIKIVLLEPCTKAVEDLLKVIVQKGQAEVERVSSSAEVLQLTAQYQPCMLIACLTENGQVPDRVSMLKKMETPLKKGLVKTMLTTSLKNAQLGNVISALGVTDFIQEPVPLRTMQFKANLQIKAVENTRKAEERKRQGEEKIVFKKSDIAAREGPGGTGSSAKVRPALQLKEDAFLFKNSGVKKVGKKFVLEMEGPAPETGEWKQHEDKGNAQTSWRWVPNEEEQGKPDNGDGWVHEGDKPEFKEATGKWSLASEKPELAYRQNGEKIAKKISVDENGEVNVAADSPTAAEAVEKTRAIAQKKREKARAKADAPRPDPAKKEKPEAPSAPLAEAEADEEKKKENPALAMLARLNRGEKKSKPAGEEPGESEEASAAEGPAEEEAAEEGDSPLETKAREASGGKKPALSPLDFLKKKKNAAAKASGEAAGADEDAEEEEAAGFQQTARAKLKREKAEGSGESNEPREPNAKGPSTAQKSLDALARMKSRLGGDDAESSEAVEEDSDSVAAGEEEERAEPGKKLPRETRGRKGKAKGESAEEETSPDEVESAETSIAATAAPKAPTRREVLEEIQARVNSPLPEEMAPEEEARLRKKYGLEGRDEIKPKDLARKDRLDAIKRLKDLLEKNAGKPEFEEKAPETNVHDLQAEENNTQSGGALLADRRESLLRAFDSEEELLAEDDSPAALAKKKRAGEGKDADLYADNANYMPAASLTPPGNAWETSGEHYVYLDSQVRYRGFEKLEDLLPLWIFQGAKIPELLDKTNQWRFYGPLPALAKSLSDVPREVRDFLLGLRDQLKKDAPDSPAVAAERAELAALDAAEEAAEEIAAAESRAGKKPPGQADGLEELFDKKKARSAAQDALDQLKNRLGQDETSEEEELTASEAGRTSEELSAELGESSSSSKKRTEGPNEAEASTGESSPENALQSRLDALKNRLGNDDASTAKEDSSPEKIEDNGGEDSGISPAEEKRPSAADFASPAAEPLADGETYTGATIDKLKSASPSFEKFLERRKAKLAAAAGEDASASAKAAPPPAPAGRNPAYLGIYVALSNSFGAIGSEEKAIGRVLRSIELSFGGCAVAVLSRASAEPNEFTVIYGTGDDLAVGSRVNPADGFLAPIRASEGGSEGETLGYLFLKPSLGREGFTAAEEAASVKAALGLWPVLRQSHVKETAA